ncbi:hypothetical protein [Saccharibacillus sp. JS10]|uniref:hypothetical protein n=1 Tax=Saccharibacillus sp. JS10 TaxID=2950552 RepID=UPI00210CBCD6|nr:hypothetical protein [Saccharibacillus sp. JS10]MCQ4085681.1 hypothetical protein [Saccharibacillus sp. JS10]
MEMHNMNNEFLKDLHELERNDEDRSKLLMKGLKKTLDERKSANRLERWFQRKRKKKVEAWHSDFQPTESESIESNESTPQPNRESTSKYRENSYETRTE